ncbi:TR10B factor, partial [Probosciger aterrimus]|nr:TR10B factor [Probosciger aterrimus]
EVSLGTAASALNRRDKLDLFDAGRGEEEFYLVQSSNIYCRKCPAGTYVGDHCKEQNGFSKCLPCKDNEYIEYPNDLPNCFGCRTCREDEVELSPCRAVQDTRCACRNGTFCSPEHPCEMCQKCRPRCPTGEVELAPCTPLSDRRCGPPTTSFAGLSTLSIAIISVTVPVVFVALLCLLKYCCCRSTGEHGVIPPSPRAVHGKRWVSLGCAVMSCPNSPQRQGEGLQPPRERGLGTAFVLGLRGCQRTWSFQAVVPGTSQPSVKPRKKLVPVQGEEPYARLRSSFYTFAQKVPHDHWKRFGRALNLLENDIALAEKETGMEMMVMMLKKWQEKGTIDASVNTLLDTLHQINLGGVAEDISCELVKEGSFQYEVS